MLLYRLFFNFWTLLSSFTLWLIFVLSLLSSPLQAQNAGLHASVDRNTVRMGETVRLTIEAMQQIDGNKINLSGLEKSFKVLGRSSSSSVSIVNGSQTIRTQLLFENYRIESLLSISSSQTFFPILFRCSGVS